MLTDWYTMDLFPPQPPEMPLEAPQTPPEAIDQQYEQRRAALYAAAIRKLSGGSADD